MFLEPAYVLDGLLTELRGLIKFYEGLSEIPEAMLDGGLAVLELPELSQSFPVGAHLPACRLLDGIVASVELSSNRCADVLSALRSCWPALRWVQNSNYRDRPEMQGYLADSGYCELVGSRGLVAGGEVSTGFLLIGPGIDYPAHDHPAAEAYVVLSGTALWWREGEEYVARSPGSTIYHEPLRAHAMRTQDEPLLAYFIWHGDIATLPGVTARTPGQGAVRNRIIG